MELLDCVVPSLSKLHVAFQKLRLLLEDCSHDGARVWMTWFLGLIGDGPSEAESENRSRFLTRRLAMARIGGGRKSLAMAFGYDENRKRSEKVWL